MYIYIYTKREMCICICIYVCICERSFREMSCEGETRERLIDGLIGRDYASETVGNKMSVGVLSGAATR